MKKRAGEMAETKIRERVVGVERVAEKTLGAGIDDAKRRGEWAEIRFMGRASAHGLQVNKPWGDSSSYDFVVGYKGRFVRVQVKSTKYQEQKGGYRCGLRGSANLYSEDAFDFLAAYVIPEDVWYIMPMELVRGRRCVSLYPNYGKSKMGVYKEAWELLKARPGRVGRIEACAGIEDFRVGSEEVSTFLQFMPFDFAQDGL
jgi:hypothetical protein